MSIEVSAVDIPYWEAESPISAENERIRVNYYPKAGKLQINRLMITENGPQPTRKNITLDVQLDLRNGKDVTNLLIQVLTVPELTVGQTERD